MSSVGETVLRLAFLGGTGASSSDLTVSETFSAAVFFVGDRELLARRL